MNLKKIKYFYKKIPYPLTMPLEKIPFEVFCGKVYRDTEREIFSFKNRSSSDKIKISESLLINYLNDAIENTRFYKDWSKKSKIYKVKSASEIFEFPILNKQQVQEDLSWFIDERYQKNSYEVTTGGSTGRQLKILMHNSVYFKEWAFVNYYLKSSGVDVNSRRLCLRGVKQKGDGLISYNPLYKEMLISPFKLNLENIKNNFKVIESFSAGWIHGYPSSVAEFANLLSLFNVRLPAIKHILLVSEKIYPDQIDIIKKVFGAKILTFYGSTERVVYAPFESNSYIPNDLYGFTEVSNNEILGTGYLNPTTRLIRYGLSDEIKVSKSQGKIDEIEDVVGRWGREFLIGKTGVKINMTALNIHSGNMDNVLRYQFHQKEIGCCTLKIILKSIDISMDLIKIKREFYEKVKGEVDFSIEVVSDIPLTSRGKFSYIVNELI